MTLKEKILALKNKDTYSNREIAEMVGCSKRTVRRVLGAEKHRLRKEKSGIPRVLILDIETAPMEVYVWRLFKNHVSPENMIKDWSILCWSAKWLFDDVVMSERVTGVEAIARDDSKIIPDLWNLFDLADIIIAHNGKNFDIPKSNARFMKAGFPPPRPYQVIDTKAEIKKISWPSSLQLDFLNKFLKLENLKSDSHFGMWVDCVNGSDEALEKMVEYNRNDVLALEDLYMRIRPWIRSHPNMGAYVETEHPVCPVCSNDNLDWKGFYYTPSGRFSSFRCIQCGAIGRSRYSDLTTSQRKALVVSTAR